MIIGHQVHFVNSFVSYLGMVFFDDLFSSSQLDEEKLAS
jgi:hypothetical protein